MIEIVKLTEQEIDKKFEQFKEMFEYKAEEKKLIEKAYKIAKKGHKDHTRYNGDPFINHPLEVAKIIALDIGLPVTSVIAALFHDLVMNPEIDINFVDVSFPPEMATDLKRILKGLWRLKGISNYFETDKITFYQKIIETIAEDLQIIYIKIADRLHNMRTLYSLEPYRKYKISTETLYIYGPLAERLGLYKIKSELEDQSFKYLDEKNYNIIKQKLKDSEQINIMKLNRFTLPIIHFLRENNYKFRILSRQKSVYSTWKKMQTKNVSLDDVYDLLAMRIIFEPKTNNEIQETRNIAEMIRNNYEVKEDRTRDWLEVPKSNGYSALHLTIKSDFGHWIEIQIRTENMDYIAEHGLAAHWKYKGIEEKKKEFDEKIEEIKQKLNSNEKSKIDFSSDFSTLIGRPEFIYVYTPKGQQIILENGSNIIDFAFYIHSELGIRCIGAKVNNIPKPIDYVLNSGDLIYILTSKKQEPKIEWLDIVKTQKAKDSIRNYLKEHSCNEYEKGKKIIELILEKSVLEASSDVFKYLCEHFILSKKDLYIKTAKGEITSEEIEKVVNKFNKRKFFFFKPTTKNKKISIDNFITATCCNPIPGDSVVGVKNNNIIIIHRKDCQKAKEQELLTDVFPLTWDVYKAKSYYTKLEIESENQKGIFYQIARILSQELEVNIKSIHFDTVDDGLVMSGWLEIYVLDNNHLHRIIKEIKNLPGVTKINRI